MIIVSGRIGVEEGRRDEFVASSLEAVRAARDAAGCRDFIVAADPLEPDRVNVYEEWETQEALSAFRGDGPGDDLSDLIVEAEVNTRDV